LLEIDLGDKAAWTNGSGLWFSTHLVTDPCTAVFGADNDEVYVSLTDASKSVMTSVV
jgi:hypothetical protein